MKLIDLTGKRYCRLIVRKRAKNIGKKVAWVCDCDCGEQTIVRSSDLKNGKIKSCGCLHNNVVTKHGWTKTPTYCSWNSMRNRCNNPNAPGYNYYGGRGIKICERWDSFKNFLKDMGKRPSKWHSIDRIDSDGDYTPENCRWATARQQGNNTRKCRRIKYKTETRTISEWCRHLNLPYERIIGRLKAGWDFAKAVETPLLRNSSRKNISGLSFGMLTVVRYNDTVNRRARWFCSCDCGNCVVVSGKDLRQGRTVSCGCKRGQPKSDS